ncbi:hypothetical protein [Pseudoxanthomonas wuyuanensis]
MKAIDAPTVGDAKLGDSVDMYNGSLTFRAVDVDLPGNSALPVSIVRVYELKERRGNGQDMPFADWDLDIPRLEGIFAPNWYADRCSGNRSPPSSNSVHSSNWWYGNYAKMPGGGVMLAPATGAIPPATGENYRWVTPGNTWLACLPSIKNGQGEGFLAIDKNGVKYWFDWMAQYQEPALIGDYPNLHYHINRRRNVLYVTRVMDRFGNEVNYTYSNSFDAPARLVSVSSTDGRRIDIASESNGKITSVTANGRTWMYGYGGSFPDLGNGQVLTAVNLPDGSAWSIHFEELTGIEVGLVDGNGRSCTHPGFGDDSAKIGEITSPAGLKGTFEAAMKLYGRTNVPKVCDPGSSSDEQDDSSLYVINYWLPSLQKKTLSGPGVATQEWVYQVGLGAGSSSLPGSWSSAPSNGGEATCLNDSCAGSVVSMVLAPDDTWIRYTYGTSYRYNEHLLLSLEEGAGDGPPLRTTTYSYQLDGTSQPFPETIGVNSRRAGEEYIAGYYRPLKRRSILVGGRNFIYEVDSFDYLARPLTVTRTNQPQ